MDTITRAIAHNKQNKDDMKTSPAFKQQIQKYLSDKATSDALFAPVYAKENKNIDDCLIYILSEVKKKAGSDNAIAMTDDEVYSLAIHYYDENDIKVGEPVKATVEHKATKQPEKKVEKKSERGLFDDDDDTLF